VTRLEIGRVGRPHGLRGEVTIVPITNRAERFEAGQRMWSGERQLVIATSRPHHGGHLVRFEGIDDRNAAEALRGAILTAEAPGSAPPGEVWVHQVIGVDVHDRAGAVLGRVVAVEANPASDLLVLDGGSLIPMVFVVEHTSDALVVDVPEGLLDL
jgi:16S rRNA processing protein RimM